ncbi:calponin homology domain-containing protein [Scheffersomyces amazonensis]|uniref:calponin homology domain-containing protein n=1 Tax=Scheffersomyces amazonensis TaxID=1078765 RepID=UPI00315C8F63
MVVSESRSELLQWLNSTLELNYTKVEQCGTGAAFCQLLDSIVGGIPMLKVKFDNANGEYDYRQNWKVLQAGFNKHRITKNIDVEKLVKCRLQDNLELLQWFRKFWLENKRVNDNSYDPKSRRKVSGNSDTLRVNSGSAISTNNNSAGSRVNSSSSVSSSSSSSTGLTHRKSLPTSNNNSSSTINNPKNTRRVSNTNTRPLTPSNTINQVQPVTSTSSFKVNQLNKELNESIQEINHLNEELNQYKLSSESLETERNFYFNKLREIEILIQNILDGHENNDESLASLTVPALGQQIQSILYMTEPGFQVSQDNESQPNHINDENIHRVTMGIDDSVIHHDVDILDAESF